MNTKKLKFNAYFFYFLFISFLFSLLYSFDGYAVIQISSIENLQKIGNDVNYPLNEEYQLSKDIDASDTSSWNGGMGFVPIGTEVNPFTGKFDGNGYKVRNLYINRSSQDYVGLFGRISSSGEVFNLGLKDIQISGGYIVGGLVGYNEGIITKSYAIGTVSGLGDYIAVLVGYNGGTVETCYSSGSGTGSYGSGGLVGGNIGTISQCYSHANVNGTWAVGGLVGYNYGSLLESYSKGTVSGSEDIGGLLGYYDGGTLTSCYWDMESSGLNHSAGGEGKTTIEMEQKSTFVDWDFEHVWGIKNYFSYPYFLWQYAVPDVEGMDEDTAKNEITSAGLTVGTITVECSETVPIGKVISQSPNPREQVEPGTSINFVLSGICINNIEDLQKIGNDVDFPLNGNYVLTQDINADVTLGWNGGAGFIPIGTSANPFNGRFNGKRYKIHHLFINRPSEDSVGLFSYVGSSGKIYDMGLEINFSISGGTFCAALVANCSGLIERCYAVGPVIGGNYSGGLVGWNSGIVSQSYANVSVTGNWAVGGLIGYNTYEVKKSYAIGSVNGNDNVGGLVGYNIEEIDECYSRGSVTGSTSVGGLVGTNIGYVSSSYWDINTSGQNNSTGGIGKTTEEMKRQATFTGWDFVNVWGIEEDETYPYLLWQYLIPDVTGMLRTSAENVLTNAGFTIGTITGQCGTIIWNKVISQNPSAGTVGRPGMSVDLTISVKCITSLADLEKIGNDPEYPLDGEYALGEDIDASSTIEQNLWSGFSPIGTASSPFTGKFYGNGYKIYHLYINRPSQSYVGLFGYIETGGEVHDLFIEDSWVSGRNQVGILAGYNKGTISRCYTTGSVAGANDIGGLIGSNAGNLSKSYFSGFVTGYNCVGGLLGRNEQKTVSQCFAEGEVSGGTTVGGLIGFITTGTVEQSYSTALVQGNGNVGGLVGINGGTVNSSYWDINTSGQSASAGGIGKTTEEMQQQSTFTGWDFSNTWSIIDNESYPYLLDLGETKPITPRVEKEISSANEFNQIGYDWNYPWNGIYTLTTDIDCKDLFVFIPKKTFAGKLDGKRHTIQNLYIVSELFESEYRSVFGVVFGEVNNVKLEISHLEGNNPTGGLACINYGNIFNCYIEGPISGNDNVGGVVGINYGSILQCYKAGSVTGNTYVGGLVGDNYGVIQESFSMGSVSGESYIGGLAGNNSGNIINCFTTASVTGTDHVAGLVSYNEGTIQYCYSTGAVIGTTIVGGLIGVNINTVSSSYWDIETSGQTESMGGEGKTTEEMMQQSTFVGWDFMNIWGIVEDSLYPYLSWRYIVPDVTGKEPATAEDEIILEGFQIGMIDYQCDVLETNGKVISQSPSGGSRVTPNSTVNIVVSVICINSIEELQKIGNDPNYPSDANYILEHDIDASDTINWNDGMGFIPLCSSDNGFTGKFNGNNYKITNLYINRYKYEGGYSYSGLFLKVGSGGEIQNVYIENAWVTGDEGVGGLVGYNQGRITKSKLKGAVIGRNYVGGLVGINISDVELCNTEGSASGYIYI